MKILRVIPFLDFGGVEQRLKLAALGFATIPNVELFIVVLGNGGQISNELEQMGVKPLILNSPIKIPNLKLIYTLYQICKKYHPDVVHCSGSEANFHGLIAAWLANVSTRIGEEIGFPNHGIIWKLVFRLVYLSANKLICISYAVKQKVIELGEIEPHKIQVVYNPVASPNNSSNKANKDFIDSVYFTTSHQYFNFITVSRLVQVKNIENLIYSFHRLSKLKLSPEPKLWIVGDGPLKKSLTILVKNLHLEDRVIFFGYQKEVYHFLRAADVFVLPSFSEGFSMALVEAMSAELVCIATKNGGPSEIIENGVSGLLINPENIDEIEASLLKAISLNSEEKKLLGTQARLRTKDFAVEKHITNLCRVYEAFFSKL